MGLVAFCLVTPITSPHRDLSPLVPTLNLGTLLCRLMDKVELRGGLKSCMLGKPIDYDADGVDINQGLRRLLGVAF
jgi:hypothetical protein